MSLDDRDYMRKKYLEKNTNCNKRWSVGFKENSTYNSKYNNLNCNSQKKNIEFYHSNNMQKNEYGKRKYIIKVFLVLMILMIVAILYFSFYLSNGGVNIY